MSFLGELKSRKVFRVGGAYIVAAWALIQVADTIFPQLNLPDWAPTLVTVLLILGFPVALLLAWFFDITPDGIKRTRHGEQAPEPASRRSAVTYFILVGSLFLLALYLAVAQFGPVPAPGETADPPPAGELPSVAVLPFVDMSPDASQGYFGDGMAEELLNELTRLEGLRVAGRTSSFAYKGSTLTIPEIGQALKVQTVLEGSVRKDANRLRITAQLIDSGTGYHLWSNTYDRDFGDVFVIQKEIAEAITGVLGIRLGIGSSNAFKGAGTGNVEAYEYYLKGNAELFRDQDTAQRLLDKAIELDPGYAAAWAVRGVNTASKMWNAEPENAPALVKEAYGYVKHAVELDPDSAQVQTYFGTVSYGNFQWSDAQQAYDKAINLREDREVLGQYGNLLMRTGRLRAARLAYDRAEKLEPLDGRPVNLRLFASIAEGQFDEAQAIYYWRPASDPDPVQPPGGYWQVAINQDDRESFRESMMRRRSSSGAVELLYAPLMENLDDPQAALAILQRVHDDDTKQWVGKLDDIALLAAYFGDPELALEAKAREVRLTVIRMYSMWYPVMAEMRGLPGFKQLVVDLNLVEYWRAYGWADSCRPVGEDDFSCSLAQ